MKNLLSLFPLVLFCGLALQPAHAQEWIGGINLAGAFPQGELKDNLVDEGVGVGFYALRRFKKSPWYAGLDVTAVNYGDRHFDGPFESCCGFDFDELTVRNNILGVHAALRWQPEQLPLRPYGEALIGIKRFETTTRIGDDFDDAYDNTEREVGDTTFSAGLGGGLLYQAWGSIDGPKISLELGARYLFGNQATYVREETVSFDGVVLSYLEERSETDLLTVHLGVHFRF